MRQWTQFQRRNPRARMVCIDIQPYATAQAPDSPSILNVGGFSDQVFQLLAKFAADGLDAAHWVDAIEAIRL